MKKKYDVVFITTFVSKEYIETLISSIINTNKTLKVLLLVICQNGHNILTHAKKKCNSITAFLLIITYII